ncbi:MAG TPA: hypothetical protein VHT28_10575, partial [Silvibacterium sp.]|nr:hypothetical protein [Silvibacterium sp.]
MTEHTPPDATERFSRSVFAFSIAGALVFLYLRTFLLPATPFVAHDDQVLFFIRAARVAHGQVLYRDFFELVPPGIDLLYGATFRLFGIHAWIMQAWGIALGLALFSVITLIASRILRGPLILLPGLLFLVFDFSSALDPTHHWYSTLAALAAVGILTGGASLQRIFAAGLLCAIATLFTQTQGALTFVALVIYLLWLKRSGAQGPSILTQLAALTLPFILILCSVLGYYISKAGFRTIFFDLVLFPLRFLSSGDFNSPRAYLDQHPPVHTVTDILRPIPYLFIYAVVPYIYFLGLYQLWRKGKELTAELRQRLVLLHLVGFGLFLAVSSGPRFHRLSTVAPPAILICVWLLSQPGSALRVARNVLCILAIAFAFLLPFYRQTQWHATLNLPIGRTAFSDPLEFNEYQWLAQRTHPSELFFNHGGLGLYLSLNNPTASEFVTDTDFTRPEQVTEVLESLQRHPPRFIMLEPERTNSSGVHDNS